jgi:hypothetical protein
MCQLRCAGQLFSGMRFSSIFQDEYVNAYSCTMLCQERSGEISCEPCAMNTQRYIGVLSGANRTACQCKEGATFSRRTALAQRWIDSHACACGLSPSRLRGHANGGHAFFS